MAKQQHKDKGEKKVKRHPKEVVASEIQLGDTVRFLSGTEAKVQSILLYGDRKNPVLSFCLCFAEDSGTMDVKATRGEKFTIMAVEDKPEEPKARGMLSFLFGSKKGKAKEDDVETENS